ncbi:unnamed protein product [Amoebophrya sp. A25]|nr:unnamed protein product [Amoebophrya sp. A25]|eukprot:GSA25T00008940001.1
MTAATNTPSILWAQRPGWVFMTIDVKDCKEPEIDLDDSSLKFKGESSGKTYEFNFDFHAAVDKEESKINKKRVIELVLKKKEEDSWPRLSKAKLPYVKIDWNKWVDSDDEGEDFDTAGSKLMAGMGGGDMGGMGGMPGMDGMGGDEDSDDEDDDLPDLDAPVGGEEGEKPAAEATEGDAVAAKLIQEVDAAPAAAVEGA